MFISYFLFISCNKENASKTSLFPNPCRDFVSIVINGYNGYIEIQVYDLSGRHLNTNIATTNAINLNLKDYAKGIYVFRVAYGDIVEDLKVVKE